MQLALMFTAGLLIGSGATAIALALLGRSVAGTVLP